MAIKNLFEKYGIKDVADVTFYRIEKKEELYEAQRTIGIASVLRGAVEIRTVYPFKDGQSTDEGFQAYVFTDAEILTGANYDCDDGYYSGSFTIDGVLAPGSETEYTAPEKGILEAAALQDAGFAPMTPVVGVIHLTEPSDWKATGNNVEYWFVLQENASEAATGISIDPANRTSHADKDKFPGTHEFSYMQQAFMLFAKRQNLINKTGTRYTFSDIDNLVSGLVFEDNYSLTPYSDSRVVVLGVGAGNESRDTAAWDDLSYSIDEVNETLASLTSAIKAKAYDVTYSNYAELVVEDEMGYYNPNFLKKTYSNGAINGNYDGTDSLLKNATMWGNGEHYSINDAIDALRQQRKLMDADASATNGIGEVYGGYKVSDTIGSGSAISGVGHSDTEDSAAIYSYYAGAAETQVTSKYALTEVLDALDLIAANASASGKDIEVNGAEQKVSNRAIYVGTDGSAVAASSYVYLLHNINYKKLATDTDGIFSLKDRKGTVVYYQDKIFAGVEYLALVVVGNKGLIFVVNRHGDRANTRVAWMVEDGGYLADSAAKKIVANGLFHTIDVTVNNETFEATCAVKNIAVRKTKKTSQRYIPVLFLDCLKVSTLEQTAEETYATGGHGNANLIGWDFGKAITLNIQDALFTPASMSASFGAGGEDFRNGVKETKSIDRMEKVIAKRSFIVPEGNQNGTPSEADKTTQAVFYDPKTMEPYADGTPIAEGEIFYKWTRSIAYEGQSIGNTIEISADEFPGTYKVVGETFIKNKDTGKEERFQFVIPQAKMDSERTITLEADGDPVTFDMNLTVLRPDDGVMLRLIQYNVVENEEENDGSTMVENTENLKLLDDAELYKVGGVIDGDVDYIGATEY